MSAKRSLWRCFTVHFQRFSRNIVGNWSYFRYFPQKHAHLICKAKSKSSCDASHMHRLARTFVVHISVNAINAISISICLVSLELPALTVISLVSYFQKSANSADPDQTPHHAASDLGLHCLLLGLFIKSSMKGKYTTQHP